MASQMMEALMELCQEKHIDQLYLIDRLEESLAKSYTDILHLPFGAEVTIDRATGKVYVYELVPVEESYNEETDEYAEFTKRDVTPKDTSRIAAKHAKEEINAIVRNSARQQIFEEFSDRIGDIITGTVLQSTPDFTIVKIREGVEAELPHFDLRRHHDEDGNPTERNERPAGERYLHNQRIKAVIIDVRDPNSTVQPVRGEHSRPPIVISRTHPMLIRRLFELEVPEVYEGTVEVMSVAREPGQRSKVAVRSLDPRLDPVGACVGPKGSRVRTVVSELRGERVDVILWGRRPVALRCQRSLAGQGHPCAHRRGEELRRRDRPRRPALARHRQGGTERPPRRPPHRLAHRHQERVARRGHPAQHPRASGARGEPHR